MPSDPLRPATWTRFEPSLCAGCRAGCCTLPVLVSPEDLFHMGILEAAEVNAPPKTLAPRLKKAGFIQSLDARTGIFTLRQKKGGDCLFLDENRRCAIYDRRPSVCRIFPANSARPGYCPNQPNVAYEPSSASLGASTSDPPAPSG